MINAVGYIRMSSDKQEASPEQQRQEIISLAERDGYRIIRWYLDEGISGDATDKRLDFQRMIRDSETREFQAVLCWDQDRFGRFDSIEAGHWIHPLRENGVHLVTVAQGKIDWNDFAGRMLYGIQQEGKHAYLRDLSRNVCRGLREKAKQGKWPAGTPPFGYDSDADGRLVLGEANHVRVVQRLYRMYLDGNSMMAIYEQMKADGEPAPGPEWNLDTVKRLLKNEIYTGDFIWGDRKSGKYNHVTDEPIFIPHNHTSIVDRNTFDAVQQRRAQQRGGKTPRRNGGTFVLSGLAKCECCGSAMYGHAIRRNNYLICGGHLGKGKAFCSRNSVREDVVLDHVIEAFEREYLNPVTIQRLREELRRQVKTGSAPVNPKPLKKRLAKVEKQLDTARRNMVLADADLRSEFEQVFRELKLQQRRLAAEVAAAAVPQESQLAEQDQKVDRAIELFLQLRTTCQQANPIMLREFLRKAVEKVVIRVQKTRQGRRDRYHLLGGDIHMQLYNLGLTPRRAHM
jgi:site-specific DNA recombinase